MTHTQKQKLEKVRKRLNKPIFLMVKIYMLFTLQWDFWAHQDVCMPLWRLL